MAIAALVIHSRPDDLTDLMELLRSSGLLSEFRVASATKIAAALECPADKLLTTLQTIQDMPGVLDLELAYINYEDEIANGSISCPPIEEIFAKRGKRE